MFSEIRKRLKKVINDVKRETSPADPLINSAIEPPKTQCTFFAQGNAATGNGNFAEAVEFYKASIAADAVNPSAHIGLGFALLQLRNFEAATAALTTAVALNPQSADGFYMLGKAYVEVGEADAAETAWSTAHALSPTLEYVYCDFCLLLFNRGNVDRAKALIEEGISRYPLNADFHFYLGNLLSESGDFSGAVGAYQRSMALNSPSPHLLSSLGNALRQTGDIEQSIEIAENARLLAPESASIFSNYLLSLQYTPKLSKKEKFEAHLEFSKQFEFPLTKSWTAHENDAAPHRILKIGYVSGDFRHHSLIFFIEPIIRNHDRSKFEIYCYYSHPVHDEASERIKNLADHWVACSGMSDNDLATKIRSDKIDILIDLSGHTGHNRLLAFARKPAPVQMTWLGYQATTGLRSIDFRITDESLDPTGTSEVFHAEKLLRLPSSGTFSPSPESPPVNSLPVLDGNPFVFGCLNNPSKITSDAILMWSEILKGNISARLLIGNSTPDLIRNFSVQFAEHGVDSGRIIFLPKVSLKEYFGLHHQMDLALDTFPYNGGTTTFHSLWMGVPIIALQGDTALSNVGASVMRGLGLGEFCADTKEQYVNKALHFSNHPAELSVVRQSLRERMTSFTNLLSIEVTTSLEEALRRCWIEYCDSAPRNVP